jgi:hypothetical protein
MSKRMYLAAAALAAAAMPMAAAAQPVGNKPVVTLDRQLSYMIVRTSTEFAFPIAFLRRPDKLDIDDYLKRRAEALAKAHAKWVRKHASYVSAKASWDQRSPAARQGITKPVEPVEPTDANLAFPAIEQENIFQIGPFDRFAKDDGISTFLYAIRPGRYVFYGPVYVLLGQGTCMCMGSIEFEVKPGQIVNAGTMRLNLMYERKAAKEAGRPLPKTDLDLPETMNSVTWLPPVDGDKVDPRLASYAIIAADLRAAGRIPNYFGAHIDRLTPVPGVLEYDRDRIVDVKAGK